MKSAFNAKRDGFTVDVGYVPGKKTQPRFYLGRDEAEARIRKLRIHQLWESQGGGTWSAANLAAAKAIASGEPLVISPPNEAVFDALVSLMPSTEQHGTRAHLYRQTLVEMVLKFPGLKVVPSDPELAAYFDPSDQAAIAKRQEEERKAVLEDVLGRPLPGTRSTHELLDAYRKSIIVLDHDGTVTEASNVTARRIEFIRRFVPDVSLPKLDYTLMQQVARTLFNRPTKKNGDPASVTYSKTCLKTWKDFIRYVTRTTTSKEWNPPRDWESAFRFRRKKKTDEERAAAVHEGEVIDKKQFSNDELRMIWTAARKRAEWKVMFLLGLNCGHGVSETCKLQWVEVQGDIINRLRPKTEVYGKWKLWPETVDALSSLSKRGNFVLVRRGTDKPYLSKTENGVRSDKLAGRWKSLLVRAGVYEWKINRKGERYKAVKSYGKLRKTSSTFIRSIAGAELASMQLAHGQPADDKLLEVYARKPWEKLFAAQTQLRQQLFDEGVLVIAE